MPRKTKEYSSKMHVTILKFRSELFYYKNILSFFLNPIYEVMKDKLAHPLFNQIFRL